MIRNRLSVLLAERNLKITRVAKDTGIARSTITSISQNDVKMIQLETINTLCIYLGVTPCEFFEFSEYDVKFSVFGEKMKNFETNKNELEVTAYMDFKKGHKQYSLEFIAIIQEADKDDPFQQVFDVDFKLQDVGEYMKIKDDISVAFWTEITSNFVGYIIEDCEKKYNTSISPFDINVVFE